jgi:hypothetical protein
MFSQILFIIFSQQGACVSYQISDTG